MAPGGSISTELALHQGLDIGPVPCPSPHLPCFFPSLRSGPATFHFAYQESMKPSQLLSEFGALYNFKGIPFTQCARKEILWPVTSALGTGETRTVTVVRESRVWERSRTWDTVVRGGLEIAVEYKGGVIAEGGDISKKETLKCSC